MKSCSFISLLKIPIIPIGHHHPTPCISSALWIQPSKTYKSGDLSFSHHQRLFLLYFLYHPLPSFSIFFQELNLASTVTPNIHPLPNLTLENIHCSWSTNTFLMSWVQTCYCWLSLGKHYLLKSLSLKLVTISVNNPIPILVDQFLYY